MAKETEEAKAQKGGVDGWTVARAVGPRFGSSPKTFCGPIRAGILCGPEKFLNGDLLLRSVCVFEREFGVFLYAFVC